MTKDLKNKVSILNGPKYFSFDKLQSYLVFDLVLRDSIPFNFSTEIETDGNKKNYLIEINRNVARKNILNPY